MIAAAGLLVLVGLGLFVAGVLTGETALYWGCVGVCVVAAVLLVVARLRMRSADAPAAATTTASGTTAGPATATLAPAGPTTASTAATGAAAAAAAAPAGTSVPPEAAVPATPQAPADGQPPGPDAGEPPVEEVEVTDLLLVVDLEDEVLVVDEHPRYHLAGCRHLAGRETIPIPHDEARTDGFTPCGTCRPDSTLAAKVRAARNAG